MASYQRIELADEVLIRSSVGWLGDIPDPREGIVMGKTPTPDNDMCALSDEFVDGLHDDLTLKQAVIAYRKDRGYGDGGWGEYFATKLEQFAIALNPEERAREQFAGLFDWLRTDLRFEHLAEHAAKEQS